jgi:hypothetical protein
MVDDIQELLAMADMYASTCTRQEEKYQDWLRRGYTWRWEDCEAALNLLKEQFGTIEYSRMARAWREEHKCRACGFPKEHHAFSCRATR